MESRRARRILILAFALSLLVHAIVALNVQRHREAATPGVERVFIERRPLVIAHAVPPRPTPPPKPPPAHSPAPAPRPHASVKPLGRRGHAVATARPQPVLAASARPTPTARPCSQTNAPAALVKTPPPPIVPVAARAQGTSGTTVVTVSLDPHGTVIGTALAQSSGNAALDAIATSLAQAARYAPSVRGCRAVAGTFAFSVEFAAW